MFRAAMDISFSPNTFDDLLMEGSVENPIVLDEEEDKHVCQTHGTSQAAEKLRFWRKNRKYTRLCL